MAVLRLPASFTPTHDTDGLPGYNAIDVFGSPGEQVASPAAGTVRYVHLIPWDRSKAVGGQTLYLDTRFGSYFLTHFGGVRVRDGDRVRAGQIIGTVGKVPGGWWSPHIHEGLRVRAAAAPPPSRGRPPRPPAAGAAGASQGSSDAAAGVWGRYIEESDAAASPADARYADLHIGPWRVPGTGFIPFDIDPLSPIPGVPGLGSWNPLDFFRDAADVVGDVGSFLKWVAWLFSPRNILRIVEFLAGAGLIVVGLRFALEAGRQGSSSRSGGARRLAGRAFSLTPPGRGRAAAAGAARSSSSRAAAAKPRIVHHYHPVGSPGAEREERRKTAAKRRPYDPETAEIPF